MVRMECLIKVKPPPHQTDTCKSNRRFNVSTQKYTSESEFREGGPTLITILQTVVLAQKIVCWEMK